MSLFAPTELKINNPAALGNTCGKCQRYQYCNSPRMKPLGNKQGGMLIIGEAPTRDADKVNMPITGDTYEFLTETLREFGVDIEHDCVLINAISCQGKTPAPQEIDACRGRVWKAIATYKPKVILVLGMLGMESLLGHRWNKKSDDDTGLGTMTRWAGWAIPDRQTNCFVVPTWHPRYILQTVGDMPAADVWFRRHIKTAVKCLHKDMPKFREESGCIELITDPLALEAALNETARKSWFVFDYETTGIKPYRKGHEIYCVGIAYGPDEGFAFPVKGNEKGVKQFCDLLADPNIGKVAHNASYEDLWSRVIFNTQVQNWRLDTIQAAHIQNQNPGLIGLKFQAYVRFGLVDYSSHIAPYLETPLNAQEAELGTNGFNSISKCPMSELLRYCAIDCVSTYRLAVELEEELKLEVL